LTTSPLFLDWYGFCLHAAFWHGRCGQLIVSLHLEVVMNTFSHAGFVSRRIPDRCLRIKSQDVAAHPTWTIMSRIGWIVTIGLLAFLLWQLTIAQPLWPPAISGLLLVIVGVLAGLRMGADSATAYTNDVHRLNKVLAEQNSELQEANAILLKQVSSESAGGAVGNYVA
jgi:hypothetical protein